MLVQKAMKNRYEIKEKLSNIRLDKVVCELDKNLSRVACQRLIEEENITVNRESTKSIIQSV